MAQQTIDFGAYVGDPTADTTYEAFLKTQANFTELYLAGQALSLATQPSATPGLTSSIVLARYFHIDNYLPLTGFYSETKLQGVFSIASGSNVLTNTLANFLPIHTGQTICLFGAGAAVTRGAFGPFAGGSTPSCLVAVMTYVSDTQVALTTATGAAVNAGTALSSVLQWVSVGTDASQAAVNAYSDIGLLATPGIISVPSLELNPNRRYLFAANRVTPANGSGMFCNRAPGFGGNLYTHGGVIVLAPGVPWTAGNPGTGNLWNPMRTTNCIQANQNTTFRNVEFQAAGLVPLATAMDAEAFAWGAVNSMAVNGSAILVSGKSVKIERCPAYGFQYGVANATNTTDSSGNVQGSGGGELLVRDCTMDNGCNVFLGAGGDVQTIEIHETEIYINPSNVTASFNAWTWPSAGGASAGQIVSDGAGGSIFSMTGSGVTLGAGANLQSPPVWGNNPITSQPGYNAVVGQVTAGQTITITFFDANGPVTPTGQTTNRLVGTFVTSTTNPAGFDLRFAGVSPTTWYEVAGQTTAGVSTVGYGAATLPTNAGFAAVPGRPGPSIWTQNQFTQLRGSARITNGNGILVDGSGPYAQGAIAANSELDFDGGQDMGGPTGGYAFDFYYSGNNCKVNGLRLTNIFGGVRTRNCPNQAIVINNLIAQGATVPINHNSGVLHVGGAGFIGHNSNIVVGSSASVFEIDGAFWETVGGKTATLFPSTAAAITVGLNNTGAVPNISVAKLPVVAGTGLDSNGNNPVWLSSILGRNVNSIPLSAYQNNSRVSTVGTFLSTSHATAAGVYNPTINPTAIIQAAFNDAPVNGLVLDMGTDTYTTTAPLKVPDTLASPIVLTGNKWKLQAAFDRSGVLGSSSTTLAIIQNTTLADETSPRPNRVYMENGEIGSFYTPAAMTNYLTGRLTTDDQSIFTCSNGDWSGLTMPPQEMILDPLHLPVAGDTTLKFRNALVPAALTPLAGGFPVGIISPRYVTWGTTITAPGVSAAGITTFTLVNPLTYGGPGIICQSVPTPLASSSYQTSPIGNAIYIDALPLDRPIEALLGTTQIELAGNIVAGSVVKYITPNALTPAWVAGTNFGSTTIGTWVRSNGNIYALSQQGTAATTGNGPWGTGSGIVDGGAKWNYVGPAGFVIYLSAPVGSSNAVTTAISPSTQIMLPPRFIVSTGTSTVSGVGGPHPRAWQGSMVKLVADEQYFRNMRFTGAAGGNATVHIGNKGGAQNCFWGVSDGRNGRVGVATGSGGISYQGGSLWRFLECQFSSGDDAIAVIPSNSYNLATNAFKPYNAQSIEDAQFTDCDSCSFLGRGLAVVDSVNNRSQSTVWNTDPNNPMVAGTNVFDVTGLPAGYTTGTIIGQPYFIAGYIAPGCVVASLAVIGSGYAVTLTPPTGTPFAILKTCATGTTLTGYVAGDKIPLGPLSSVITGSYRGGRLISFGSNCCAIYNMDSRGSGITEAGVQWLIDGTVIDGSYNTYTGSCGVQVQSLYAGVGLTMNNVKVRSPYGPAISIVGLMPYLNIIDADFDACRSTQGAGNAQLWGIARGKFSGTVGGAPGGQNIGVGATPTYSQLGEAFLNTVSDFTIDATCIGINDGQQGINFAYCTNVRIAALKAYQASPLGNATGVTALSAGVSVVGLYYDNISPYVDGVIGTSAPFAFTAGQIPWASGATITSGNKRLSNGSIWQATSSGTTGATPPTGTSQNFNDGGVFWQWLYPQLSYSSGFNLLAGPTGVPCPYLYSYAGASDLAALAALNAAGAGELALSSGTPGTWNKVAFATGTWTPSISAATPGDLALSSVTASATYTRIGNRVFFDFTITATLTWTTASGVLRITGLPFTAANAGVIGGAISVLPVNAFPFQGSATAFNFEVNANTTFMTITFQKAATAAIQMTVANLTSGTAYAWSGTGSYPITATT